MTTPPLEAEVDAILEHALLKHANDFAEYLQGKMSEPSVTQAVREAKQRLTALLTKAQAEARQKLLVYFEDVSKCSLGVETSITCSKHQTHSLHELVAQLRAINSKQGKGR